VKARANFVLFVVNYSSGTRDLSERGNELSKMFDTVKSAAERASDIDLFGGDDPAETTPIETIKATELFRLRPSSERTSFSLVMRVAVRDGVTFEDVRQRAEGFAKSVRTVGRVEYDFDDEQFLEVANPARHRQQLLQAIAQDVAALKSTFGDRASATVNDIGGRIQSQPSGPLEVEIYIPYTVQVVSTP